MTDGFIVVYDDQDMIYTPMQFDPDCEGAVCAIGRGPVAMFVSKRDARRAISVSAAYARLQKAQGKVYNDDFVDPACRKRLKIVPLECRWKGGDS